MYFLCIYGHPFIHKQTKYYEYNQYMSSRNFSAIQRTFNLTHATCLTFCQHSSIIGQLQTLFVIANP